MKRKPSIPDETPLEFFANLQIPAKWKFICDSNFNCGNGWFSYGKMYELEKGIVWRICFYLPANRGAICERDSNGTPPKFSCILNNKQAPEVNEFINKYGTSTTI
jgi:hypothetical protein